MVTAFCYDFAHNVPLATALIFEDNVGLILANFWN